MNRTILSACLFALAAGAVHAGQVDQHARELMVRTIRAEYEHNVIAIISQEDPDGNGYQTIKVERSREGKVRHTVLGPLSQAGYCSVDDGVHSYMYLPDQKLLIEQDSRQGEIDESRRLSLAMRNYSFRVVDRCKIAGRAAECVEANPKDPNLEVRRYYLDEKTAYPLRLETVAPGADADMRFDTKDIQYPHDLDPSIFAIQTIGEVDKLEYRRPSNIDVKVAQSTMGFPPLIPHGLPMGFEVQEVQLNDSKSWHALIVRLTDGLVRATVYQWRISGDNPSVRTLERSSVMDHGGIRLLLVSDLATEMRERLLEAFISDSEWLTPRDTISVYSGHPTVRDHPSRDPLPSAVPVAPTKPAPVVSVDPPR